MNAGSVIKYYRTKNKMTQSQLAEGICSISHLSKIESNTYTPHESTIEALLLKMGVRWKQEKGRYERLERQMNEFVDCVLHYDLEEVRKQFGLLEEEHDFIRSTDLINLYELYKFRLYISENDASRAGQQQELLEKMKGTFTSAEVWLHTFFLSMHYTMLNKKEQALELLRVLDRGIQGIPQKFEGEYFYQKARLLVMNEQYELSTHFAEQAIQHFQQNNNYIRLLHGQLLLAINYTRRNLLVQASGIYEVLKRNSRLMGQTDLYHQTLYNYAELLKSKGDYEQAFELYRELQENIEKGTYFYKAVLASLVEAATEIGADAWEYVNELRWLSRDAEDEYFLLYLKYFEKRSFSQPDLLVYSEEKMFPYFKKNGYIRESKLIAYELSKHFQKNKEWEKAMYYRSYYDRNGGDS